MVPIMINEKSSKTTSVPDYESNLRFKIRAGPFSRIWARKYVGRVTYAINGIVLTHQDQKLFLNWGVSLSIILSYMHANRTQDLNCGQLFY